MPRGAEGAGGGPDVQGHRRYDVCGIPISAITPAAAADTLVESARAGGAFEVHLCNAYTLSLVGRDSQLNVALNRADLNLPDGTPVAWLGRRYGTLGPVRGAGLLADVVDKGLACGLRHFFYGGAEGVATELAERLAEQWPSIEIVGLETPPYRDLDDTELSDLAGKIRASQAQIVWVGLGTPRQDYLVPRLAELLDIAVVPVGAAFDFLAGRVQEAPPFLHGSGLEWLHRLSRQPRRLWRRYLIGNPRFLLNVLWARRTQ